MKSLEQIALSFITLFFALAFGLLAGLALSALPVNDKPCFGTAKNGLTCWHSKQDCAH